MRLEERPGFLIAHLGERHDVLSWAIVGGGLVSTETVVWHHVTAADLAPPIDPAEYLRGKCAKEGLASPVALMTSRRPHVYSRVNVQHDGLEVQALVTAGLSNALRIGDPPVGLAPVGTINVLCRVSHPLAHAAMLETMSLVAEARTAATLAARWPSRVSSAPATGTGTDCIAIAAPAASASAEPAFYAGKHTVIGCLVGDACFRATEHAIAQWKLEQTVERSAD